MLKHIFRALSVYVKIQKLECTVLSVPRHCSMPQFRDALGKKFSQTVSDQVEQKLSALPSNSASFSLYGIMLLWLYCLFWECTCQWSFLSLQRHPPYQVQLILVKINTSIPSSHLRSSTCIGEKSLGTVGLLWIAAREEAAAGTWRENPSGGSLGQRFTPGATGSFHPTPPL